jgi:lycopene cyclase domain-containing protein
MTYAQFLLLFVVPPIALLGAHLASRRRLGRRLILALAVTACLAVVYTGPCDSTIIAQGVWSYPPGRVLGPTLALVPLEEYAFFVLQVLMTGCLTASLLRPRHLATATARRRE